MDYALAFRRPFTSARNLFLGWLFGMIPVVGWVLGGYGLACARTPRDARSPSWNKFADKFIQGVVLIVITLAYAIPFLVAWILVIPAFFFPLFWIVAGLAIVACLVVLYAVPSAAIAYSKGTLSDAFKFRSVFAKAFTWRYFQVVLVMLVVLIILGIPNLIVQAWLSFGVESATDFMSSLAMFGMLFLWGAVYGGLVNYITSVIAWTLYGQALEK